MNSSLAFLRRFLAAWVLGVPLLVAAQAEPTAQAVRVTGAVARELALDRQALPALPQASASVADKAYEGVPLWDVLSAAGLAPAVAGRRHPTLSMYVLARGDEGYQALFSVAELDPALGARGALLAHRVNGAPLGAGEGLVRLVVPGDLKPSRAVFRLVELRLQSAP
ncbi:molybdopterin-dependent oxidoreductase [Variovorax terrae]|uniref:Molybdopterin-dependent oxidoreductase n=1 Tax=Variovorax terrae TaxID=2923278 RepID=A0A9X2APS3_9BURK|nr:molybdopterin-dependent oxidoreductase [Variovorax terrae]MCJ0762351.1 molybdopterin-dependent oxidoreductase [Variovorax terrae]